MNIFLFLAGLLAVLVGIVHSILGERLIFSRLRQDGLVPTLGKPHLAESHVRILWATWHLSSLFGCCLALFLFILSFESIELMGQTTALIATAMVMFLSAALVFIATQGRHKGWLGLLGVAILILMGLF